jgi:sterol 12-alpha-hydroxylase
MTETLRLRVEGLSLRGVTEDTTLSIHGQPYSLEKGSMVFLAMPLVHKDPEIHEDPDTYKVDRFIHMHTKQDDVEQKVYMKKGVAVRTPLFPWGGGHFMVNISFGIKAHR